MALATIGQSATVEYQGITLEGRTQALMGGVDCLRSGNESRDHPHGGGEGKTPLGMPGQRPLGNGMGKDAKDKIFRRNDYQASEEEVNHVKAQTLKSDQQLDANISKRASKQSAHSRRKKTVLKTWSRWCTIIPDFIGLTIAVHDGRKACTGYITENMVGHRLGEFAPTRTFRGHTIKEEEAPKKAAALLSYY